MFKQINTEGITYIQPVEGSRRWFWGNGFNDGDLFEAEENYKKKTSVTNKKLILVSFPDGEVIEPVEPCDGEYFGVPVCYEDKIMILSVNYRENEIKIYSFKYEENETKVEGKIPLSSIDDCYNLSLKTAPLMLTREGSDSNLEIIWPLKKTYYLEDNESFVLREDNKLYFSIWEDEPEYKEQIIVRDLDTGSVLEEIDGAFMNMPDGTKWILR